jgi:branched-chain amino acid transport system ATP-binding protein
MSVIENLCVPLEYACRERGRQDVRSDAMAILELVGFAGRTGESSASLTQVELRKLELARALAAEPALLVADEAMAGLSSAEVDEILAILLELNQRGVAVIMIEHIMRAVMRFSERVVVLDAGRKIAEGTPEQVIADPAVERAYLGE